MDATRTYPTPDVRSQISDCWRAYRLAELEGRLDTAAAIMKRINALLDCVPRA